MRICGDRHYSCGPQILFTLPKVIQIEMMVAEVPSVPHVCTCRDRLAAASCRAASLRVLSYTHYRDQDPCNHVVPQVVKEFITTGFTYTGNEKPLTTGQTITY